MAEERKRPAPPLRGMILIDDKWQIRRYGLIKRKGLTCIYGHKIRPQGEPFEIAIPCLSADTELGKISGRADFEKCDAQIYVVAMRAKMFWAMDVTGQETELIKHTNMDPDEIVEYFGVGFPVDMKITRL